MRIMWLNGSVPNLLPSFSEPAHKPQIVRGDAPSKVVVVGGSITVGHGALNGFPWPTYLSDWLADAFPTNQHISFHNGAVAGTMSDYMAVCSSVHIPLDASLVIFECVQPLQRILHGPAQSIRRMLASYHSQ